MKHRMAARAAAALALAAACDDGGSTEPAGVARILAVEPASVTCTPQQRFGLSVRYEADDIVTFVYAVSNANVAVEQSSGTASATFQCRTVGSAVVTVTMATPRRSVTATVPVTIAASR